ncbi:MAG: hypothetical protein PHG58_08995 [Clostridia bacterium]|nr:hypothetical protein [Clostridia bacterium]
MNRDFFAKVIIYKNLIPVASVPDLLLIYQIDSGMLLLVASRTGNTRRSVQEVGSDVMLYFRGFVFFAAGNSNLPIDKFCVILITGTSFTPERRVKAIRLNSPRKSIKRCACLYGTKVRPRKKGGLFHATSATRLS